MKENVLEEIGPLAAPLNEIINKYFDPNTIIVIQHDRFDVYCGQCGAGMGYYKKEE